MKKEKINRFLFGKPFICLILLTCATYIVPLVINLTADYWDIYTDTNNGSLITRIILWIAFFVLPALMPFVIYNAVIPKIDKEIKEYRFLPILTVFILSSIFYFFTLLLNLYADFSYNVDTTGWVVFFVAVFAPFLFNIFSISACCGKKWVKILATILIIVLDILLAAFSFMVFF